MPKPRILGADGAGVVEALGDGVTGLAVGQRVVLNPGLVHGDRVTVIGEHFDGTHAELIAIAAEQVFPLDDDISFETAAAFPLVFETAYRMLVTREAIREGNWALIWGIGGGVATASFEICRAFGVNTIVTSGSPDKLATAREWGADVVLDHHADDVVAAVKEATGGRGRRRRRDRGRGDVGAISRGRQAVRPRRRVRRHDRAEPPGAAPPDVVEAADRDRFDDGHARGFPRAHTSSCATAGFEVHIDRVFPLAEAAAAHARLEAGEQLGKIVLSIPG